MPSKKLPYDKELTNFFEKGIKLGAQGSIQFLEKVYAAEEYVPDGDFDEAVCNKLGSLDYQSYIEQGYGAGVVGFYKTIRRYPVIEQMDAPVQKKFSASCAYIREAAAELGELELAGDINDWYRINLKNKDKIYEANLYFVKLADKAHETNQISAEKSLLTDAVQEGRGFLPGKEREEIQLRLDALNDKGKLPEWMAKIKENFVTEPPAKKNTLNNELKL